MVKHVVMFKMKTFETDLIQNDLKLKFKSELESLIGIIPQIKSFEVGINTSESPAAYDLSLISEFESNEDLDLYRKHPDHARVLEFARQVTIKRRVVDYEV
jgi:hypothetical protein